MRYALAVEYDGSLFHGWQYQSHARSVQQALESALAQIANQPVRVHCCGRTDQGVHASMQIVHFDADCIRSEYQWCAGANSHLPEGVKVIWACKVSHEFEARHGATKRFYRYIAVCGKRKVGLFQNHVGVFDCNIDPDLMQSAAQSLKGHHDFSAFRAAGCSAKTPYRTLFSISIHRRGEMVIFDFCANAFLYHMIRNMVSSLVKVGSKKKKHKWIAQLLEGKDRTVAAPTAPAAGLYLTGASYPEHFNLPVSRQLPILGQ